MASCNTRNSRTFHLQSVKSVRSHLGYKRDKKPWFIVTRKVVYLFTFVFSEYFFALNPWCIASACFFLKKKIALWWMIWQCLPPCQVVHWTSILFSLPLLALLFPDLSDVFFIFPYKHLLISLKSRRKLAIV